MKYHLDILKMYLHKKNEVSTSRLSKRRAHTEQTDTHTETQASALPATLMGGKNENYQSAY